MSLYEEKYNEIVEKRRSMVKEISELKNDSKVKRYLSLKEENDRLYDEQLGLVQQIRMAKYQECDHIWVNSKIIYNDMMNNAITRCGCVKCGLDQSVIDEQRGWLPLEERIMYDFLEKNPSVGYIGVDTDINCDLSLAQSIYRKIDEKNPYARPIDKIRYLSFALHKIRDVKVTEERKENRAKRLNLKKNFHNWDSTDVWSS